MQLRQINHDENEAATVEGGFLQTMGRRFGKLGRRLITPLALVATISGSVNHALAQPRQTYEQSTQGDLESATPDTREIADYFAQNKAQIIRKINNTVQSGKYKKLIVETVNRIAQNQNGAHFRVEKFSRGHSNTAAQFHGGKRTLYISDNFNVEDAGSQSQLVHEAIHSKQDEHLRQTADEGSYMDFWYHGTVHSGEQVVVSEYEDEATAAQLLYLDAQLDGEISHTISNAETFAQARKQLNTNRNLSEAVPDAQTRTSLISKALFFFGDNDNWHNFIRYVYECEDGRAAFTPRLQEIGRRSSEECDEIAQQAGIHQ